jgi:hypothetical protein
MEEKKLNSNMRVVQDNNENEQKLSYEQLNKVCGELSQQNQYLIKQLQQVNLTNMFRRLDYLFLVLKYSTVIKDADFINDCIDEIKEAMTIEKKPEEGAKEE